MRLRRWKATSARVGGTFLSSRLRFYTARSLPTSRRSPCTAPSSRTSPRWFWLKWRLCASQAGCSLGSFKIPSGTSWTCRAPSSGGKTTWPTSGLWIPDSGSAWGTTCLCQTHFQKRLLIWLPWVRRGSHASADVLMCGLFLAGLETGCQGERSGRDKRTQESGFI